MCAFPSGVLEGATYGDSLVLLEDFNIHVSNNMTVCTGNAKQKHSGRPWTALDRIVDIVSKWTTFNTFIAEAAALSCGC